MSKSMIRIFITTAIVLSFSLYSGAQTFIPDLEVDLTDKSQAQAFFPYPQCLIDGNKDLVKWSWMADEGYTYENSDINPADDWIVSQPIEFKSNNTYTITITARCSHSEYPERFELKLGKNIDAAAMTETVIAPTTINHRQIKTYTGNFTSTQNQNLRIGVHAISDVDMARLHISHIGVSNSANVEDLTTDQQPALCIDGHLLTVNHTPTHIYSATGQLLQTITTPGRHTLTLPHGVYIARCATQTLKIAL